MIWPHSVDQERPVGHRSECRAKGPVVGPCSDDEEWCSVLDSGFPVDRSLHDCRMGVVHSQREVVHDGRKSAFADAVPDLLPESPAQRAHVHIQVHIGAVLLVEVVPGGVEDPDLLRGFGAGAPVVVDDRPPLLDGVLADLGVGRNCRSGASGRDLWRFSRDLRWGFRPSRPGDQNRHGQRDADGDRWPGGLPVSRAAFDAARSHPG